MVYMNDYLMTIRILYHTPIVDGLRVVCLMVRNEETLGIDNSISVTHSQLSQG